MTQVGFIPEHDVNFDCNIQKSMNIIHCVNIKNSQVIISIDVVKAFDKTTIYDKNSWQTSNRRDFLKQIFNSERLNYFSHNGNKATVFTLTISIYFAIFT